MLYEGAKTKRISFPLGGIGTGCIGLAGNGELTDFEIFNRPNKNSRNGFSHFAVKATQGGKSTVRVLHGDTAEDLSGTTMASTGHYGFGFGPRESSMAGFPHFRRVSFEGAFPVAKLSFADEAFPAILRLTAFNPLIPHNEFDSSLPAAFFEWEIENVTDEEISFALALTLCNPAEQTLNRSVSSENMRGILFQSADKKANEVGYSDLTVLTDAKDVQTESYWYRGSWKDGCTTYWKNLLNEARLPEREYAESGKADHGTVAAYLSLKGGEKARVRFVIAWNVPVFVNYFAPRREEGAFNTFRNYYATQFESSLDSARYALGHFSSLYEKTVQFSEALQGSSLPLAVKDAVSANLSVIKTPTAVRLEDGSFWGFEGCSERSGCCFGSCQHVWNYAYALPYLFPRLERSMRENMLLYALHEDGKTSFRLNLPLKLEMSTARACVDGQMGEIIKCYREWKLSGDDEWIRKHLARIYKMLEYAFSEENPDKWDADMDGVLEGRQHHTLDTELFGPSAWLQGFYLLALYACAELAAHFKDEARAAKYRALYEKGRAFTNEKLFNGRYFYHKVDLFDKSLVSRFGAEDGYWNEEKGQIKYQVAEGCMIDQMLADWHAALIGLPEIFDGEKKRVALRALYENNYKPSMYEVTNMWRTFSLNDEAGTVICSYPEGCSVPAIPISYCEETMTGFEYALAGLMVQQGYLSEAETMVKAVRDRYDGEKRNPWNEIECGSNYARSMASFALLPLYSGFTADMTKGHLSFAPVTNTGRYFFSAQNSWGSVSFEKDSATLTVLGEPLSLQSLSFAPLKTVSRVTVDGKSVPFILRDGKINLDKIVIQKTLCAE